MGSLNLPDFMFVVGPLAGMIPTNVQIKRVLDDWTLNSRIIETVEAYLRSNGYMNQGSREAPDWVKVSSGATVWIDTGAILSVGVDVFSADLVQSAREEIPTILPGVTPRSEEGVFLSEDWWEDQIPTVFTTTTNANGGDIVGESIVDVPRLPDVFIPDDLVPPGLTAICCPVSPSNETAEAFWRSI